MMIMLRGRKEDEMLGARVERDLLCSRPDYTLPVRVCVRAALYIYRLTDSYASDGVAALGLVLIRRRNGG